MGLQKLGFRPVGKGEQGRWFPPTDFRFVPGLDTIPLSDSELLQTSHHLPLLVEVDGPTTRVVAGVSPALVRQSVVDEQGRWLRAYMPLALRCLPFHLGVPKTGEIARGTLMISDAFTGEQGGAEGPAQNVDRLPSPAAMTATLVAATTGMAKLGHAADRLVLADLLVPIGERGGGPELFTLSLDRLGKFTAHRAAALVLDSFLPMHLLFAMVFSRRHLTPRTDAPNLASRDPVAMDQVAEPG
ncbi:SapC family protein [Micromonospora sp. STR1s_5]|nr:SapC family protein [Micromonospora sp. STR1s_5]